MPRCRRKHQSWEPYTTSSTDWLERESPDSTMPANRIQAGPFPAGPFPGAPFPDDAWWRARRTYSATDIPKARASRLARSYSRFSRLICVRIMLSPEVSHDNTGSAFGVSRMSAKFGPPVESSGTNGARARRIHAGKSTCLYSENAEKRDYADQAV